MPPGFVFANARVLPPADCEQLPLFDLPAYIDLPALRIERAAAAALTRSPSTRDAYACDWRAFAAWCELAGRPALPASADTVSLFLVDDARSHSAATVTRRTVAIADRHRAAGLASPVTEDVAEVLAGLRRRLGTAPRLAKSAIAVDELRRMVAAIDGRGHRGIYSWELPGAALRVARDRALLVFGFATALRRSEIVALDLVNVDFVARGLTVHIRKSKTDQVGAGEVLGIPRGRRPALCPVRVLAAWLAARGNWAGPLFYPIDQRGAIERRRLRAAAVADVVKSAARRAGLDPAIYAGHSLRAGCATAAAEAGAGELAIAARTRHRSLEMLRRYVRSGSLFAVDPLAGCL